MKDWMIRAIRTFAQTFFGILIPEVCIILTNGFEIKALPAILTPVICSALAGGISACWNIIDEHLNKCAEDELNK